MRHDVRGRVFKARRWAGAYPTWCYEVVADGDVVLVDNTGDWRIIYDACLRSVAAADRIVNAGHRLRPYSDIVREARDCD